MPPNNAGVRISADLSAKIRRPELDPRVSVSLRPRMTILWVGAVPEGPAPHAIVF